MPTVQGLDRAAAPDAATAKRMLDAIGGRWWNVYIGGPRSAGSGWSPALVREYVRHGIDRFMLTYVGRQWDGGLSRAQGQIDARDALRIARGYGYSGNFPLCLDVEMRTFNSSPSNTIAYTRAWCETVRAAGVRPGVYANPAPLTAMARGGVKADFVWVASWLGSRPAPHGVSHIPGLSDELWSGPGQRAWQYAGQLSRTQLCRVLGLDVDIDVADIGCLAPPPGAVAGAARTRGGRQAIRRGARGAAVVRLTHRLSLARSPRTGQPYLDGPRRSFDARTEQALKAFQREHGLSTTGAYGRASAQALLEAAKRAKAQRRGAPQAGRQQAGGQRTAQRRTRRAGRRRDGAGVAATAPAATRLPALVKQFERLDAEASRAWQLIEAYGAKRRRTLTTRAASEPGLAAIAASLGRIEHQLGTLVELEQRELAIDERLEDAIEEAIDAAGLHPHPGHDAPAPHVIGHDGDGDGPQPVPAAAPAPPPRRLAELTDAELDARIDALDQRLDRARRERIARCARIEQQLVHGTGAGNGAGPVRTPATPVHRDGPGPVVTRPRRRPRHAAGAHRRAASKTASPLVATPETRSLQHGLNRFTKRYLKSVPPLEVDGKKGTETDKRIHMVKHYLGYEADERTPTVTSDFIRRLRHPRSTRYADARSIARAARRRRRQRKAAARIASGPIEGTPRHIVDTIVVPIAAECGIRITPASVAAANADHGPTRSGLRSDHQGPPDMAWAADMSNSWRPTPQMDLLARRLAQRFDIPWDGAGTVNASHHGYRFQLLYRTEDHYNHVHLGIKVI